MKALKFKTFKINYRHLNGFVAQIEVSCITNDQAIEKAKLEIQQVYGSQMFKEFTILQ